MVFFLDSFLCLLVGLICMPLLQSAIKRARQSEVRRQRRQPFKTHMKTMIRTINDLSKEGKNKEAVAFLPLVYKSIDTAAKKHLIHPKNAARKKSKVAKLVSGMTRR